MNVRKLITITVLVVVAVLSLSAETFVFKSDFNLSEDGKTVICVHEWHEHINQDEINALKKRFFELKKEGNATQKMWDEITELERTSPQISRIRLNPCPREKYEENWAKLLKKSPKFKKLNIDKVVFEYGSSEPTFPRARFGM